MFYNKSRGGVLSFLWGVIGSSGWAVQAKGEVVTAVVTVAPV